MLGELEGGGGGPGFETKSAYSAATMMYPGSSPAFLNSSKCGPHAWYCSGPQVREAPLSHRDINAGNTGVAPTASVLKLEP